MDQVRGGEVAGLDGHGDEAAGRGGQAPHVHAVRAPDPAREVLPALLARGTRTRLYYCLCMNLICFSFARAKSRGEELSLISSYRASER